MNYKDMAVINEKKLKEKNERLKVLLYNAMVFISEELCEDDEQKWFENMLGMTKEEYKEIMEE